ncbi:general substrate transporter [Lophiotrema nucula]|uniref:General substrate transporter n=1 Tax=Lophiotrema nucula TaxID=690887 RepID=A0A6A5YF82_9PLEO|nr:general substrate transporter [Lophiotrema nucula]
MAWFGYDQGVFSVSSSPPTLRNGFQRPGTRTFLASRPVVSRYWLGAFFGAICAFTVSDKLRRKKSVTLGLICSSVGAILQIVSWYLPQMLVGRIINGFGMGATSSVCPVYQAECSKPSVRGKLVVVGSLCNTAAFCLSNWMNYALYFEGGPLQWRFALALQLIFPIVVTITLCFVPESPRCFSCEIATRRLNTSSPGLKAGTSTYMTPRW